MKPHAAREALPSGRTCGVSKRNCDVAKPAFAKASAREPRLRSDELQGIRAKANKNTAGAVMQVWLSYITCPQEICRPPLFKGGDKTWRHSKKYATMNKV